MNGFVGGFGEAISAIDCRNRPPTRYQGAADIVACPDLAWQGVNRCTFVTWISAQRCSSRLKPQVRTESFAGPDRIQQGPRKIGDSALNSPLQRPTEGDGRWQIQECSALC